MVLAVLFCAGLGVPTTFPCRAGFEFCTGTKGKYRENGTGLQRSNNSVSGTEILLVMDLGELWAHNIQELTLKIQTPTNWSQGVPQAGSVGIGEILLRFILFNPVCAWRAQGNPKTDVSLLGKETFQHHMSNSDHFCLMAKQSWDRQKGPGGRACPWKGDKTFFGVNLHQTSSCSHLKPHPGQSLALKMCFEGSLGESWNPDFWAWEPPVRGKMEFGTGVLTLQRQEFIWNRSFNPAGTGIYLGQEF